MFASVSPDRIYDHHDFLYHSYETSRNRSLLGVAGTALLAAGGAVFHDKVPFFPYLEVMDISAGVILALRSRMFNKIMDYHSGKVLQNTGKIPQRSI